MKGFILSIVGSLVFVFITLMLLEMAIWGWSFNAQVPDYMAVVGFCYGVTVGVIGFNFGRRYL